MRTVDLGGQGLRVPVQGLGAMGMSVDYGAGDERESVITLNRAVDLGVTFIDTAESYGPFENEKLIARALGHRRDEITLATKFGLDFADDGTPGPLDGRPEHIRRAVERSLRHLGTDVIDLYYMHRVDPGTPVEDTVGAMAELVTAGKVRYIGLSEVSSETIRRAHAVHPLTAVQSEMSLFTQDLLDNGRKATMDELGIGLVASSPMGRGFLSGAIRSVDDLAPDDARRGLPRFSSENIAANLVLVERVREIAQARGATPGQVALAWVNAQGAVAIPGTKRRKYLEENAAAADLDLSQDERAALDAAVPAREVSGARYTARALESTNR
ncbi:aldo/keto reductase [Actinacidiphila glaucinigra]|uniref:aldo/keto reductase n=1 Tax=Actinacidiphila glaucinigra TaxID=235986 RepID=UPI002DDC67D1|nr:aldo/keto reductase [Actinacidiphila glaucinigra]WSD58063.1 aldo/keto reductase [Actinacidiphila glaucinigra]